jgi:hypothetical protein
LSTRGRVIGAQAVVGRRCQGRPVGPNRPVLFAAWPAQTLLLPAPNRCLETRTDRPYDSTDTSVVRTLAQAHTRALMHTCMSVRGHIHTCMHTSVHVRHHTHSRIHAYTHTHIHTYTHTRIHAYTHRHIHTYTHTRMHAPLFLCLYGSSWIRTFVTQETEAGLAR